MNVWEQIYTMLLEMRAPQVVTAVAPWEQRVLLVLALSLTFLIVVEDWRLNLLAWAGVGVTSALLLVTVLPVSWAVSRAVAAGMDGSLLWLGARRWSVRRPLRPGSGLWVRIPVLAVALLVAWQVHTYVHLLTPDALRGDAMLLLFGGGVLLLALGGEGIRGPLGLLLLIYSGIFLLTLLRVPTMWFWALTVLDIAVGTVGGMTTASGGIWARQP